jgi:hypothetical protein
MTGSQIIVFAIPVFLLMMLGEFALARHRGIQVYRFSDAVNSLSLGGLSQLSGLFTKLLAVGIYTAVFDKVALFPDTLFWGTWYGVILALVFYDPRLSIRRNCRLREAIWRAQLGLISNGHH